MNKKVSFTFLILALLATAGALQAESSMVFDDIMRSYEDIRLILLEDSAEGISPHAEIIHHRALEASNDDSTNEDVKTLLPRIAEFAKLLTAADGLVPARAAFYELSKMMVQYRAKVSGEELPIVMYCSMAKRSWLQLAQETGNPYHGQSMASCGEVVD